MAPYQSRLHALLEELGIELFPAYRDGENVYVDESGAAHRYAGHEPVDDASMRAYEEAEAKLDAIAKELDPEAPWMHPDAAELDATTFEAWLRREVADEVARDLLRAWLAGGFMTKPAHTFSVLQGAWVVAGAGGTYELFAAEQCLAYRVVGGSQLTPLRLAERLGDRVLLDAPAREIRWTPESVEVDAGDVRVRARSAIVAVAPNLTGMIRFEPALPPWRLRLEQAVSQGCVTKVLAVYEQPFWRADGLSGEGFAPYGLVREIYDNTPPSASVGRPLHVPLRRGRGRGRADESRRPPERPSSTVSPLTSGRTRSTPSTTSRRTGVRRSGRVARTPRPSPSAGSPGSGPTSGGR